VAHSDRLLLFLLADAIQVYTRSLGLNEPMAHRPTIYCLTNMNSAGMDVLHRAGRVVMASGTDTATLRREVAATDPDAIVTRTHGDIDGPLMDLAPRLIVIGRHGVGYDQIDIPAATDRGIQVVTTPGANKQAVCEHVFALMIGISRHFPLQMAALNAGRYHDRTKWTGRDLWGKTIGIVGFGNVGRRVGATAFAGFNMKVLYNDIIQIPVEDVRAANATFASLDQILSECEYISLHVPLDPTTRRMIGREQLASMRRDAILINTCRGPVVDEQAVAEALDAKMLWGYGADVFDIEPPPANHPLIGRSDVMLTPHCAAQTVESLINMAQWMAEDVERILRGEPPHLPLNDPKEVARNRAKRQLKPALEPDHR
jgi:D-3-phosphoglycerate dehydrogenase / 2-oxoglutarate reductase